MKPYKPVVRYREPIQIIEGQPAFVYPLDHPSLLVSNTTVIKTTPVIHITRDAQNEVHLFETHNTIYILDGSGQSHAMDAPEILSSAH